MDPSREPAATVSSAPGSPGPPVGALVRADLLVVAACGVVMAVMAWLRADLSGDGLRHVPIALGARPVLGEPRWLLFPTLLFGYLRPLVALGVVRDVSGAIGPLLALVVASGVAYLWALRLWLTARGEPSGRRALAVALAFACAPFMGLYTDLAEPQVAAALAALGLAWAARMSRDARSVYQAVLVAAGSIALATLLYQSVWLAAALIPAAVPARLMTRRSWAAAAGVLALAPLVVVAVLVSGGDSVRHAVERLVAGEENRLYRSYLRNPSPGAELVALAAGPPQALAYVSNFSGLRTLARSLAAPATRASGAAQAAALLVGAALVLALVVSAVRGRQWALVVGAAGLLVLPVLLRPQQYGYSKYHVLVPIVAALAIARWRPGRAALAASLLLTWNGASVGADIVRGRRLYAEIVPLYERVDSGACWLTSAFTPPIPHKWPGTTTAVLGTLAAGRTARGQAESLASDHRALLARRLEACFCDASVVMTGDMTEASLESLGRVTSHFGFAEPDLAAIVWRTGDGQVWLDGREIRVVAYSERRQLEVCLDLRLRAP